MSRMVILYWADTADVLTRSGVTVLFFLSPVFCPAYIIPLDMGLRCEFSANSTLGEN
jgi:hypothetical protein